MKPIFFTLICVVTFVSCGRTQNNSVKISLGIKSSPLPNEAVATFSEGCFWHAEIVFQSLIGVRDAVSGYAGGNTTAPDYEKVSSGTTGHAETVQVYYDPSKISYETLVKAFFASQDPTQADGQGYDIGTQYRSIAFYRSEIKEKQIINAEIKRLTDLKIIKIKL
ncbi:MAG: peptide-methionine (S)-S-oxide reductase MsrA [Ferruginibacter sp.]